MTNFSSKAAMEHEGWHFEWSDNYVFLSGTKLSGTYCKGVPSTSYCGFTHPNDGTISYIFSYSGTATLQYGQSWHKGSVRVMKNDKVIDSMSSAGSSSKTFDFSSGDVLKIEEVNSVINIHKLTLTHSDSGDEKAKGTFIVLLCVVF